jgi:hypothetical protein
MQRAADEQKAREAGSTVFAFFVAPLPLPAVVVAIDLFRTGGYGMSSLSPPIYFCSLLAAAVAGLPAYLVGRRLNLIRWWSASLAGSIIGAAAVLVFLPAWLGFPTPYEFLFFAVFGTLSGLVFWIVWWTGHRPCPTWD